MIAHNILESVCKFFQYFEVKAQDKPEKKRKWLLSRQYLQPLNELEEQNQTSNNFNNSFYRKKVKCAYYAAKHGMQEGVLTGIFAGGCWGIYKYITENFNNLLTRSSKENTSKDNNEEKKESSNHPQNEKQSNTNHSKQSSTNTKEKENRDSGAEKSRPHSVVTESNQEDRSRKSDSTGYKSNDRSINDSRQNRDKTSSVKSGRSENTKASERELLEENRTNFRKSRERTEIVGYVFIQTAGTNGSDDNKSDDSDNQKNMSPNKDKTSPKKNTLRDKKTSDVGESSRTSKSNSVTKSLISNERQIPSVISLTKDSAGSKDSRSVIRDTYNKSYSESPARDLKNISESLIESDQIRSKNEKAITETIDEARENTRSSAYSKSVSIGASVSETVGHSRSITQSSAVIEETPLQESENEPSTRPQNASFNISPAKSMRSRSGSNNSEILSSEMVSWRPQEVQDTELRTTSVRESSVSENFIPDFQNSPSILVDGDLVSNGYSSSLIEDTIPRTGEPSRARMSKSRISKSNVQDVGFSASNISEIGRSDQRRVPSPITRSLFSDEPSQRRGSSSDYVRSVINDELPDEQKSSRGETSPHYSSIGRVDQRAVSSFHDNSPVTSQRRSSGAPSLSHDRSPATSQQKSSRGARSDYSRSTISHGLQNEQKSSRESDPQPLDSISPPREEPSLHSRRESNGNDEMEKSTSTFIQNVAPASEENSKSSIAKSGGQTSVQSGSTSKDSETSDKKGRFSLLSALNDNIIVFSACNCAIVLGVVCSVISTTRASLSI